MQQNGDQPVRLLVLGDKPADTSPASADAALSGAALFSGWGIAAFICDRAGLVDRLGRLRGGGAGCGWYHQRARANQQHLTGTPPGPLPPLGFPLGPALLLGLGGLLHLDAPAPLRRLAGLATLDALHVLHHLLRPPRASSLIPRSAAAAYSTRENPRCPPRKGRRCRSPAHRRPRTY